MITVKYTKLHGKTYRLVNLDGIKTVKMIMPLVITSTAQEIIDSLGGTNEDK